MKTLIRLGGCPGWHESSLGAQSLCWFRHVAALMITLTWLSEAIIEWIQWKKCSNTEVMKFKFCLNIYFTNKPLRQVAACLSYMPWNDFHQHQHRSICLRNYVIVSFYALSQRFLWYFPSISSNFLWHFMTESCKKANIAIKCIILHKHLPVHAKIYEYSVLMYSPTQGYRKPIFCRSRPIFSF